MTNSFLTEAEKFSNLWSEKYGDLLPISHNFKWTHQDRWLRIHSLDKSKRYAETDEEYQQILKRQNYVLSDIISLHELYYVVYMRYDNDISDGYYDGIISLEKSISLKSFTFKDQDSLISGRIFIKALKWNPNDINDILSAIADDMIRVIIMPTLSDRLIVPYDGGLDLILENTFDRDNFYRKYTDWTSNRSDGL